MLTVVSLSIACTVMYTELFLEMISVRTANTGIPVRTANTCIPVRTANTAIPVRTANTGIPGTGCRSYSVSLIA